MLKLHITARIFLCSFWTRNCYNSSKMSLNVSVINLVGQLYLIELIIIINLLFHCQCFNVASGMSQGEAKRQAPPTTVANPKPSKRGTINTRSSDHWLFGASLSELPQTKLPLKVHIIRRYLFLKDLYFAGKNMNASHKNALVGKIADELIFLWKEKGNLPTVDRTTVVKKMLLNITSSLEFSATNKSRYSTNQLWINKILKENFFDLFYIFVCRCFKDKKEERNVTMDNCKETCGMVQFCSKEDFEFYVEQKFHWNEPFQSNRKNSKFVETSEVNENQLNQNLPGNS